MKILLAAALAATPALAQDARDTEIFGAAAAPTPAAANEAKLADTLQVGGRLELRATANKVEDAPAGEGPLNQLRQADVFFDARPNPAVRAFLRARFVEPTGEGGVAPDLDELWIKSDWARTAFFTAGKQHVKWGSGHIWNPTDFTATSPKNPFDLFDRRLGATMIKVHVPDEKRAFNYYAALLLEGADRNGDVGGVLRGEFAFLGTGELALSLAARRSQPTRLGLDVSTALGPVDVFVEAAASRRETRSFYTGKLDPKTNQLPVAAKDGKKTFTQLVTGIAKVWKYSDDDKVTLGAEFFQNGLGYDDRELGIYSLVNRQSQPLYVGKRYAGAYVTVPSPGSWNDTAFYLNALKNFSDGTARASITATWTLYKEATLELFANRCFGDFGELCFRVPGSYQSLAQSPALPPAEKPILAALPTKRTVGTAGAGFSMKF